jgi:hypothetical protein
MNMASKRRIPQPEPARISQPSSTNAVKPQEDKPLDQENQDEMAIPPTVNQVHTGTASPADEAELAQILDRESKVRQKVTGA